MAGSLFLGCVGVQASEKPRARDIGVAPGYLKPGALNAITDVSGVRVGHVTLIEGDDIRTGATAILPHGGNIFQGKVPAGFSVANGFGKFMGATQIDELGEIETPIVLTNTLNVPEAAAGVIEWTLDQEGNERVASVNAVIGETNDAGLNDIRKRRLTPADARAAIEKASAVPRDREKGEGERVAEGAVGAGTGTIAFGFKGGIGTSSRILVKELGGYTVGVLVQANFGGALIVDGVAVGEALNQFYLQDHADRGDADGSIVIIIATDAPLSDRNLKRLANRSFAGLARTGSSFTNGSGDYALAFSTAKEVRRTKKRRDRASDIRELPNNRFSPLSQAVIEATEEAILNALFAAVDMTGVNARTGEASSVKALPLEKVQEILNNAPSTK
ncbi:MAG: P1 family peptidase [Pseudomonadota bacterium]